MDLHITFLDTKSKYSKMLILPEILLQFNAIPAKIPKKVFIGLNKMILTFYEKAKK